MPEVVDRVREVARADRGQRVEMHGEDQDEQEPCHVGGTVMQETEQARDAVQPGVRMGGRVDAERHADDHGEEQARDRQHDRVGQRAEDEARDVLVADEVDPEITVEGTRDEVPDLLRHRQVELHLVAHDLRQLGIGPRSQDRLDRIARDEVHERRQERHDDEQDQRRHRKALEDVGEQRPSASGSAEGVGDQVPVRAQRRRHALATGVVARRIRDPDHAGVGVPELLQLLVELLALAGLVSLMAA